MKMLIKNSLFILTVFCMVSGQQVPDTTKSSAKVGNIFTDPANAEKFDKIAGAAGTSISAGKRVYEAAKAGEMKDFFKELRPDLGDKWKGLVLKYKNPKGGIIPMVKQIQGDILSVLQKAGDRIDMWRTTLPTIQGYQQSALILANNTVQVFKDFKVSDLWDIDRKWSRKMESSVVSNIRNFYGFLGYLGKYTKLPAKDQKIFLQDRYIVNCLKDKSYVDKTNAADVALANVIAYQEASEIEAKTDAGKGLAFQELPKAEMSIGIDGLVTIGSILSDSYNPQSNDGGYAIPKQQLQDDEIKDILSDGNRTYLEEMSTLAHLKQLRTDVEGQRFRISQQEAHMAGFYARMQLVEVEKEAVVQARGASELQLLVGSARSAGSWKANRTN